MTNQPATFPVRSMAVAFAMSKRIEGFRTRITSVRAAGWKVFWYEAR